MTTQPTTADGLRVIETSAVTGYPFVSSPVFETSQGTPYLRQPGAGILAAPVTDTTVLRPFLAGFGAELEFEQYLDDPTKLTDGTQLIKTAGQACYASFGPKRTKNNRADRYLDNLISSGHGSVLEHANFTIFAYGVARSLTHELVRHRAGLAYSQLSQRYVSGRVLRFVERPEYVEIPELHELFEARINRLADEYERISRALYERQAAGLNILSGEAKTDLRKKVQQAARSALPNETETFLAITGNIRAWRHIINMRANAHAEIDIRLLAIEFYRLLSYMEPMLFEDMELVPHTDGMHVVKVGYPKV